MKIIKTMYGVPCEGGDATLCRGENGRLVVVGHGVDLFKLIQWVEQNPLAQFREIKPQGELPVANLHTVAVPLPFEPHHLFKHLFNGDGTVI